MQLENGTWVMVMDGTKALILRNVTDGQDPNLEVVRKDENDALDSKAVSTTDARPSEDTTPRKPTAAERKMSTVAMSRLRSRRSTRAVTAPEDRPSWAPSVLTATPSPANRPFG